MMPQDDEIESIPLNDDVVSTTPNNPSTNFLDPPSYEDAIFTSFDTASPSNGHTSPTSPSSPPQSNGSDHFISISVTDPSRGPSTQTFFTYLITTRTNSPSFGSEPNGFQVRRRFRDFVALSDRLGDSLRGCFVPVRPDKSVIESHTMKSEEFVEVRRAELEKYLRGLALHPRVSSCCEFREFLVNEEFDGPRGSDDSGSRDFFRVFKELRQTVVSDWGGVKPVVVEDDKDFLDTKERFRDFEQQISNFSLQAESIVKAQQDIGETIGELGLAFVNLTKLETDEGVYESQRGRASDMKTFATAAVKVSRLYQELNTQTVRHLAKLHDYLGIMLSVNTAFSDRSSALLTVQTLSAELMSLKSRIEKLEAASSKIFGGDRSRMRKIEELKESVRIAEDAKNCAIREYERIKENNRSEVERLERQKYDDFLSMLKGFVANQAGYAGKMATAWEKVAEEFSGYSKVKNR